MFYEFYEGVRLIVFVVAVPIHKKLLLDWSLE